MENYYYDACLDSAELLKKDQLLRIEKYTEKDNLVVLMNEMNSIDHKLLLQREVVQNLSEKRTRIVERTPQKIRQVLLLFVL